MDRLSEFGVVTINIAFSARLARSVDVLQATVLAIVGRTAALEPFDPRDTADLPDCAVGTVMSFKHKGAVIGLKGDLTKRADGSDLRFSVADGVQLPRRGATRVTVGVPMLVRLLRGGEEESAASVNLSANGVLMETALNASPADAVEIRIWPGLAEEVAARGRVVRAGQGLMAVEIAPDERDARSRLATFVVEFNRQKLRRLRIQRQELDF